MTQYLFKAALCHFAMGAARGEISECIEALAKYKDMHSQFESSRECQFLTDLTATWEEQDLEKFTDVIYDFDQASAVAAPPHSRPPASAARCPRRMGEAEAVALRCTLVRLAADAAATGGAD